MQVLGKETVALKAAKAASTGVRSLLDALDAAMPSDAYLTALVSLIASGRDSLARSALRLFITKAISTLHIYLFAYKSKAMNDYGLCQSVQVGF